jgi:hypothetical protein
MPRCGMFAMTARSPWLAGYKAPMLVDMSDVGGRYSEHTATDEACKMQHKEPGPTDRE